MIPPQTGGPVIVSPQNNGRAAEAARNIEHQSQLVEAASSYTSNATRSEQINSIIINKPVLVMVR